MAHHKRKKPKSSRAGCLLCKPHKHQRAKDKKGSQKISVRRKLQEEQ
jgi:hypothetical protein